MRLWVSATDSTAPVEDVGSPPDQRPIVVVSPEVSDTTVSRESDFEVARAAMGTLNEESTGVVVNAVAGHFPRLAGVHHYCP
jgi:hypothetical protein